MPIYNVFEWQEGKTVIVATIQGTGITGPEANTVEKLLEEYGWPKTNITPDVLLHGDYLWAAKQ